VLNQTGDVSGKVIVNRSLPVNADNTDLVIVLWRGSAYKEDSQARIVSAFGTVPSEVLFSVFEARRKANRPSLLRGPIETDVTARCSHRRTEAARVRIPSSP
jgi:hypothetical protein